ncbi:MAG: penicillin-binding transpeptidase domain-containing protein [Pseudothermotoga sp.]
MKRLKVVVYIMMTVPFCVLLIRAFILQVVQHKSHLDYVESLKVYVRKIDAPRGRILTKDGVALAWDEEILVARSTGSMDVEKVGDILGQERKLRLILGEEVQVTEAEAIKLERSGVLVFRRYMRRYSNLAPHVVGYISADRNGISGIEKQYNSYLKGQDGYELVSISVTGGITGRFLQAVPIAGNDVVLTIDSKLQDYVQKLLSSSNHAGTIIVQSAGEGSILAMASYPSFDPNIFLSIDKRQWMEISNDPKSPLLNRAISATYPPGSILKPLYAIAYLEGEPDLKRTIDCTGYFEYIGSSGRPLGLYRDWYVSGHGVTDLKKALKVSCNVFFYNLALELGIERMKQYANLFMIDQLTGIDLPGERKGLYPDPSWKYNLYKESWYPGDTILCGIGQSFITLTPIEVLTFFNAIANDATCYSPHLLDHVKNQQGSKIFEYEKKILYKISLKQSTLSFLKDSLREVVKSNGDPAEEGTAYQAFKGFRIDVAGKTGTAETGRKGERSHSWFAAFSPVNSPKFTVLVMLENAGGGGEAAAPMARKIFEFLLEEKGK